MTEIGKMGISLVHLLVEQLGNLNLKISLVSSALIIKQFMWRIKAAFTSGSTLRLLSDPTELLAMNLI